MTNPDQVLGFVDTLASDHNEQIPADVYSDVILEGLYANRLLTGVIAGVEADLTGEAGDTVQVPFIDARTAQGPIADGAALTGTKSVTGTHSITLSKFGDFENVSRQVFEDQRNFREPDFVRAQTEGLSQQVDQEIFDALDAATPGSSQALGTAGDLTDFYEKLVLLIAALKAAKVKPTHVIVHPDVEAQLLQETAEGVRGRNVSVENGTLRTVAGLTPIVHPLANANAGTLSLVQAIVVDRSRAIGEAWGRRPEFLRDGVSQIEKDLVKLVTWIRYGTAVLDTTAIGHVVNPAA